MRKQSDNEQKIATNLRAKRDNLVIGNKIFYNSSIKSLLFCISSMVFSFTTIGMIVYQTYTKQTHIDNSQNTSIYNNQKFDNSSKTFQTPLVYILSSPSKKLSETDKQKALKLFPQYHQAVQLDPNNASKRADLGELLRRTGELKNAQQELKTALQIDSNSKAAKLSLSLIEKEQNPNITKKALQVICQGVYNEEKGNLTKAMDFYNQAIHIYPFDAIAYELRAFLHIKQTNHLSAIQDLNELIKIDPDFHEAYNLRGIEHEELGDYQKAYTDYSQAIKIDPNNTYYNNRGIIRFKLGDKHGAIKDFTDAIQIESEYNSLYNRGIANLNLDNRQQAIKDFQDALLLAQKDGHDKIVMDLTDILNNIRSSDNYLIEGGWLQRVSVTIPGECNSTLGLTH